MKPKRNFVKGVSVKTPKVTQAPKAKATTIQKQATIAKSLVKMKKKY